MRSSSDPSVHQAAEQQFIAHIEKLLNDPRFMIDTTLGRRSPGKLMPQTVRLDHAVDLKRQMTSLGKTDFNLQDRMPVGQTLETTLATKKWFFFTQPVGKLKVICVSPNTALLNGTPIKPLTIAETRAILRDIPDTPGIPTTIVLVATGGFDVVARELTERNSARSVILVEPNDAGGWTMTGPNEVQSLADLLDPEEEAQKVDRVRSLISEAGLELSQSGLAADKLAAKGHLPLQLVEAELKSYAKQNPGLTAKRLDGRLVLFSQGTTPPVAASKESNMPLIDKVRALFSRKGETEKKIAFLSERRAALSQQRDRAYEQIATLEQQDEALTRQFKESNSSLTKRRVTSQLVQLRKDIERRQQMLGVLNQQINVVGTHLHNLELTNQGKAANLPDSEEIASDAAAAEEMLAQLQADNELADSVGSAATMGMSAEEQALFEQLEAESKPAAAHASEKITLDHAEAPPAISQTASKGATPAEPRRNTPEAG